MGDGTYVDDLSPLTGGTVTWPTIASFGPGDTATATFTADVKFGLEVDPPTAIFNTWTLTSPDLPTDVQTNTTVHFVIANPAYTITKTATDVDGNTVTVRVDAAGDVINYQIVVANAGDVALPASRCPTRCWRGPTAP